MKTTIKQMVIVTALLMLAGGDPVRGLTFSSGSTGADGALTLTTPGTVIFDPAALGIDVDGDNVFNFTTITIGPGVIVELKNNPLRGRSVVWLATGAVDISGVIRLNGQDGHPASSLPGTQRYTSEPGPGGYSGGMGGLNTTAPQPGNGPGGGRLIPYSSFEVVAGGAVHAVSVGSLVAYDNPTLVPLRGGSGGSGGVSRFTGSGTGGGAGGGAIRIASSTSINVSGGIEANGGLGGAGSVGVDFDGGGGGSGGAIHLVAPTITGGGALSARGGVRPGPEFGSGGGVGRIRVDALAQQFAGTSNPGASLGTPWAVPLPTNVPILRVTSVGGVAVPPNPTGSFTIPDVVLNVTTPVAFEIEATNVPVATVVKLYLISEADPDKILDSTPLAGTVSLSSASVSTVVPPGFSRGYVRATW
jgi:hypothetical protein